MVSAPFSNMSRRRLLRSGGVAALALGLPACATYPGYSLTEAVRRLLLTASENAFYRLTEPGGYWDQRIAGIGLGDTLGVRGDVLTRILTSTLFKQRLEDAFADLAIEASFRAAPIVTDAVRVIGLANAVDLVQGGPRAATSALRGELGGRLIDELVPELGEAIRVASDPLVAELLNAATGTDIGGMAQRLAGEVDEAIWTEIGNEEAAIRADPRSTGDPVLIEVFGAGGPV
jgi:hypothetical protein